jgi:hypothetical protein
LVDFRVWPIKVGLRSWPRQPAHVSDLSGRL